MSLNNTIPSERPDNMAKIADGGYEGIRALKNKAVTQMVGIRYNLEKKLVQEFLEELSKDSGLAIYGYREVKKALIHKTVKILILSEGLEDIDVLISLANKNGIQVEVTFFFILFLRIS